METPILLIFSKSDTFYEAFRTIRNVKPRRLYISIPSDILPQILPIIEEIDWECDHKTYCMENSDENSHKSIDWFFVNEDEGIFLENHFISDEYFFTFCSELLDKYRDDKRISQISLGYYNKHNAGPSTYSYRFSLLGENSAWATWKRTWDDNEDLTEFLKTLNLSEYFSKIPTTSSFQTIWSNHYINLLRSGDKLEWKEIMFLNNLFKNRFNIIPCGNMARQLHGRARLDQNTQLETSINHPDSTYIFEDLTYEIKAQEGKFNMQVITENEPNGFDFITNQGLKVVSKLNKRSDIPKIVHQIYEDPAGPPEHLLELSESWKELNPEWEYRFWGKKDIEHFLGEHFPDFETIYYGYPYDVQRWDVIRYLILYKIGGLYVDMDYECLKPLDLLMYDLKCCMGLEPAIYSVFHENREFVVGNAFMASAKGHFYFKHIIDDLIENKDKIFSNKKGWQILESTGPFLTSRVYEGLSEDQKEEVSLISADLVAPFTQNEIKLILDYRSTDLMRDKYHKAFAIHYFLNSWVSQQKRNRQKEISKKNS